MTSQQIMKGIKLLFASQSYNESHHLIALLCLSSVLNVIFNKPNRSVKHQLRIHDADKADMTYTCHHRVLIRVLFRIGPTVSI